MNEQVKKDIFKLVDESRDAVVCSIEEEGFPNAKAMFVAKHEGIQTFWFSTNVSSARIKQWMENPKASIYFMNSDKIRGVMLTGHMQVCMDQETKDAFWKPGDEQYYSLGPTDPDYCMIKFTADKGNYWGQQKYLFDINSMEG
jgi:pyridoxamine 5'-phosphate oxidase